MLPRSAAGAITLIIRMPARPMVTTALTGSTADSSSARVPGIAAGMAMAGVGATDTPDITAGAAATDTVAVTDTAVVTAEAMVAADTAVMVIVAASAALMEAVPDSEQQVIVAAQ
jgi:hypothetical protein